MKPLNLPAGSVRSILTILIVGTLCFVAAKNGSVPSDLGILATAIINHYFSQRQKEVKDE